MAAIDFTNMKKKQTLISINPSLKEHWGHFLHYDERLEEVLKSNGNRLLILANKGASSEIRQKENIKCVLSDIEDYFPPSILRKLNLKSLFQYILGCFKFGRDINCESKRGYNLTYFMYLSSIKYIPAFVIHALLHGFKFRYVLNLFQYHYNVGQTNRRPLSAVESRMLRAIHKIMSKMKIRLCTDSQRLNTKLGVDFDILPMFSTTQLTSSDMQRATAWDLDFKHRQKMVISIPALSRKGKGYDKACLLIAHLRSQKDERFEFKIRNIQLQNEEEMARYLLPILDSVEVYEGVLSNQRYKELFILADIILISYRRTEFYSRTSAVLSDAVRLERPIICPQDTWMGDIIEHFGFGQTFEDGNVADMYRALCDIHDNYEQYKNNLRNSSHQWVSQNNPERCVEFILDWMHFPAYVR